MRGGRVVLVSAVGAVVLGAVYLALPIMGSDLSAQVARAGFFAEHGAAPVDLRWYGGVHAFGYSLVSPPVMALLGVRPTGVLALVVASAAFAALLVRARVPRPWAGSLVGVVCIAGNLVSGRVTYGLGVAFGLLALLALTVDGATQSGPGGQPRATRWLRYGGAAGGALLASATSPVAGLFVGLVGAALLLGSVPDTASGFRRYVPGLLLGLAAAGPLAVTGWAFGEGGWMNISRTDTVHAVLTSLVVAGLVAYRPVRVGAVLSAVGVLAAALLHTPVGLNATRLVVMFALPVLAACATLPGPLHRRLARRVSARIVGQPAGGVALVLLLGVVCWWQPPVVVADLRSMGDAPADPGYFSPLRAELDRRGLTGRVEIPPTRNYWEAAHLGDVPLARGWLRQADIDRNPLFFTTVPGAAGTRVPLTAGSYRSWLADNAVQYVAVPDTALSWVGRAEAELVATGLPYLTPVWSDRHWRLYAVTDPEPLVGTPGELVGWTAASVTFRAPAAGTIDLRVRYSRWLTVDGGATLAPAGHWSTVTVPRAGTYTLGG
ncbi:hypothetical protein [Micromonospora echinofusca]|uniref:4-amino-4-deoxy-L-arabinose transferase n=1 Tax=Micromonospora echinofusca TaxID=47858 RepID=A0ABS3VLI4_MICEH|nr:hypothetical protein [Micromonospora echinofusca]MBO4205405.1 hypothetical protein [Micromonospora echinofusca]